MGIKEIRERRLSQNDIAKIQAMASVSDPEIEPVDDTDPAPVLSELKAKTEETPAVDDVAFYGPRVREFYAYFLAGCNMPAVAATLALAAATLKACVVIGQSVTDAHSIKIPAIPVNAAEPIIPAVAKKKRGRPVGSKKNHA